MVMHANIASSLFTLYSDLHVNQSKYNENAGRKQVYRE